MAVAWWRWRGCWKWGCQDAAVAGAGAGAGAAGWWKKGAVWVWAQGVEPLEQLYAVPNKQQRPHTKKREGGKKQEERKNGASLGSKPNLGGAYARYGSEEEERMWLKRGPSAKRALAAGGWRGHAPPLHEKIGIG